MFSHLKRQNGHGELGHGVRAGGHRRQHGVHMHGDAAAALRQLRRQGVHLLLAGDLQPACASAPVSTPLSQETVPPVDGATHAAKMKAV